MHVLIFDLFIHKLLQSYVYRTNFITPSSSKQKRQGRSIHDATHKDWGLGTTAEGPGTS